MREHAQFGDLQLPDQSDPQRASDFEQRKGQLLERIEQQQKALDELKRVRKETPKHVQLKDLPEAERFTQLRTSRKHFVDTIKLIAYRTETALVRVAREKLQREDDARALVRQIFGTAVDLQPDLEAKPLTVRLHCLSTEAHHAVLEHVCGELNATETTFPGTALRLVFARSGPPKFHEVRIPEAGEFHHRFGGFLAYYGLRQTIN